MEIKITVCVLSCPRNHQFMRFGLAVGALCRWREVVVRKLDLGMAIGTVEGVAQIIPKGRAQPAKADLDEGVSELLTVKKVGRPDPDGVG